MDVDGTRKRLRSLIAIPEESSFPPPSAERVDIEDKGDFILETLLLDLNGREPVPTYFLKQKANANDRPTILYNHSHGGNYRRGKDEVLYGAEYLQTEPYGAALTRSGFNVLCFDAWCFGDRRAKTESETFKRMLWHGEVLWGKMLWDALRAVEYLVTRPEVDPARVGVMGMSMGGTLSWWAAALEPRISACVDICSMTDYHTLDRLGSHDRHGVYYYVPGLLEEFSTADIVSLIAPRWHLSLNGNSDALTPAEGFVAIDAPVRSVYEKMGHPERWLLKTAPCAHFETRAMRSQALAFLKDHL
ncbi:MAG TPA: alpha/beta fold hydrolase [Rectinemataceae bacterium]|nr:alpha/beta fold hydrolase [Rectinemataceae bacterium]